MVTNEWQHWTNQRITNFINGSNMKNKFFLYTAVLGLVVSSAASADEGFYAGLIGGANWISRSDNHHFRSDNQAGYLVGFDVGYTWCNNFSGEFEFVYRHNDLDNCKRKGFKVRETSFHESSNRNDVCDKGGCHRDHKHRKKHGSGDVEGYSVMFNGRYDICIDMCFTPYVKAGIGWARTRIEASHHDKHCADWGGDWDQNNWRHNRSKNGFAWQVGAGVSFPICDNTLLDVGYNFLRAQKEINNNSFVAALRYVF